jgi:histidinol dehydrogenase
MIKILKLNNKNSLKLLKIFLDKRKSIPKNQTSIVSKIIQNVKKNGDKAVLNYEKKFSQIKTKSNKILFSNKEINKISKRVDLKIKKSIDLAYNRIKKISFKTKIFIFYN